MKKIISLFLAVIMCFSIVSISVAPNATAVSGVKAKLDAVMSQYPAGTRWTDSFDGAIQCYGFAGLVIYKIFGGSTVSGKTYRWWNYAGESTSGMNVLGSVTSFSSGNVQNLLSKAKCGDVLQFNTPKQHTMIVYSVESDGVWIYHCNWDNNCGIRFEKFSFGAWSGRNSTKLTLLRSDNYEIDPDYQIDTRYPVPIIAYTVTDTDRPAYDSPNGSQVGRVYRLDQFTVLEIYTNGWCKINCPWSGYSDGRIVYIPTSDVFNASYTPTRQVVSSQTDVYWNPGGSYAGYIGAGDTVVIVGASGDYSQVLYPLSAGGYKCAWAILTHTHSWNSGSVTKTATCTSTGTKTYTCTSCGETKTETIAKNPNNHTGSANVVKNKASATCTSSGYSGDTYWSCCNALSSSGSTVSALGHDYTSKTTTATYLKSEATCTAAATYYYKCSRCDAKGTSTYTSGSALGHDYTSKTTTSTYLKSEATCTAAATYYYKCSRCTSKGTGTYTSGSALGHDYTSKTTTSSYLKSEATCTAAATYYYKCSRCTSKGTGTYNSGSALGHDYTEKNTSSTYLKSPATCTSAATYYYKCSRCEAKGTSTYTSGTTLPHTESAWIIDNAATTSAAGSKHTECTVCHVTIKTETIPMLEPEYLIGDINGDGEIDAADAGLISRYDAGFITLTAEQLLAGDVNKDGEVDAADAGLISRYDAGFISSF